MKYHNSLLLFLLLFICSHNLFAQVSSVDRKQFAQNLNQRRAVYNLGVNPNTEDYISVVFNGIKYNGVKAVSNQMMFKAYPTYNPSLVTNLFETLGLDEAVFDKFLFQVCLYNNGDKAQTIRSLEILCNSQPLSERIYSNYWKKYGKQLTETVNQNKQQSNNPKKMFAVPIKFSDSLEYKNKNIYKVVFTAVGVQYQNGNDKGTDLKTPFEISIDGTSVVFKSRYNNGYLTESFVVDSIALNKEEQAQVFYLKDAEQVKRNSFLSPAKVEFTLQLYWNEGYTIHLQSISNTDYRLFVNQIKIKDLSSK